MKILLANPPLLDLSKFGKSTLLSPCPGTGLSYLYSYLKEHHYNCKIYDFYFDTWDYVKKVLIEEDPDIVGITCLTEGRYSAFKLLSLIRKVKNDTIVIFGGHHSTYMYDQLLQNFDIDYIVLGEGEDKLLNLIRSIEGKTSIESVGGIAYKRNGQIIRNVSERIDFIEDLDKLPFPFSSDQFTIFDKYPSLKKIRPRQLEYLPPNTHDTGKIITIATSRGCPFNCQFCSSTLFWGKKYRFRSPKNVVDEIEYYYKNLGFKYFNFGDDAFTIKPERCIAICNEIVDRNLKIFFDCTTRVDRITDELVIWLKKAGCLFVALGVESGSIKILRTINKKIKPESVIKAFSILKKHKLPAYPLLMVGNPGETNETIKKTITLLKIIKPHSITIAKTTIFPGSDLYNLAKKQNFIDDDYWLTVKPPPYYTYENSIKILNKWVFKVINYDKNRYQLNILKLRRFIISLMLRIKRLTFDKLPHVESKFLRKLYKKLLN